MLKDYAHGKVAASLTDAALSADLDGDDASAQRAAQLLTVPATVRQNVEAEVIRRARQILADEVEDSARLADHRALLQALRVAVIAEVRAGLHEEPAPDEEPQAMYFGMTVAWDEARGVYRGWTPTR